MSKRTPPVQYVPVPVHGGVQQKVDPKQIQAPATQQCDNFSTQTMGALVPRQGSSYIGVSLGSQDYVDLGSTNDELVAADSGGLYALQPSQNTWVRRGEYNYNALGTKTILSQPVNQNYTFRQAGGVRNLTMDYIGNVGVAVWDTGATLTTPSVTGGVVYVTAFDAVTGKVFWTTSTTGLQVPAANTYALHGSITPSSLTLGTVIGASQPCVVAYKGKWLVTFCTYASGASSTASGTTIAGYMYYLNAIILTPDGTTGIPPPLAVTANSLSNGQDLFSSAFPRPYVMQVANAQATNNDGFYSINEPTNLYYDVTQNGTDLTIVASVVSSSAASTTPYPVQLWSASTNSTLPTTGFFRLTTTTLPQGPGGTVAKYATPIVIASYPGCNVVAVATITGTLMVTPASSGPQSWGTVATYLLTDAANNRMLSYPLAVGIIGTTTSYTLTVTNGYTINTWSGNGVTISTPAIPVANYINVPMMNTRQLIGDTYCSIVASRLFYLPSSTTSMSFGVYEPCVWLYATSITQKFTNLILVRLNPAPYAVNNPPNLSEIAARALYLKSFPLRQGTMRPPSVVQYGTAYVTPQLSMTNVADSIAAFRLISVDPTNSNRQIVPLPQGALLTGADTRYYDGASVRSAGWQRFPDGANPLAITTGGTLPIFTYTYYFVYVEYDAYGNAIYSSPSQPYQVTTTVSSNAVTIDTTALWPSGVKNNPIPVAIQVFRNTSLNPLQFYKVATYTYTQTTQVGPGPYTDLGPDDISGNTLLYSPPGAGELPNDPAPPSTCAVATKQRVYVASAEDPTYLFYSKPFYAGRAPIEFNGAQYIDIDPSTGPINGLAAMDNTVIVFKRKAMYLVSGDGPDATGAGQFNPPYRISVDTGLLDPGSIVSCSAGVFFRSARGIELLDRGGASVQYVGAPVEIAFYNFTVLSATVVPNQSQVRFSGAAGIAYVYDWIAKAWTRHVYSVHAVATTKLSYAIFRDTLYMGASKPSNNLSVVYKEQALGVTGFVEPVTQTVTTAWIPSAGIHGWQRVRRVNLMGNASTACTLSVQCAYDYSLTTTTPAVTISLPAGPFHVRVRTTRQVCQALCVLITATANPLGAGLTLSQVELETSVKSGMLRKPDTASF